MSDLNPGYTFGRDDLGPAIAGYLQRLHATILAFDQEHGARTLYVSRAGIRIRRALDTFVRATKLPAPATGEYFWVSRIIVARGVWNRKPDAAIEVLAKEYKHINLPEFVRGMFRFAPSGAKLNPVDPSLVGSIDISEIMEEKCHDQLKSFLYSAIGLFLLALTHALGLFTRNSSFKLMASAPFIRSPK